MGLLGLAPSWALGWAVLRRDLACRAYLPARLPLAWHLRRQEWLALLLFPLPLRCRHRLLWARRLRSAAPAVSAVLRRRRR